MGDAAYQFGCDPTNRDTNNTFRQDLIYSKEGVIFILKDFYTITSLHLV